MRRLAAGAGLDELDADVSVCRACPRLVRWREDVAVAKRASFAGEPYWGRPIPGWGVPEPAVLIVGLAPAAHGGNRTGRVFTGDRSGDWLFAALHRAGLANQATSVHAGDGPGAGRHPDGRRGPLRAAAEQADHRRARHLRAVARGRARRWSRHVRVVVALGSFGWDATPALVPRGWQRATPKPRFGHGAEATSRRRPGIVLLGCYHPSQQNTFTGKLTEDMLDDVLGRARGTDADRAPVSQPAEEVALKATQCGFDSHRGHHGRLLASSRDMAMHEPDDRTRRTVHPGVLGRAVRRPRRVWSGSPTSAWSSRSPASRRGGRSTSGAARAPTSCGWPSRAGRSPVPTSPRSRSSGPRTTPPRRGGRADGLGARRPVAGDPLPGGHGPGAANYVHYPRPTSTCRRHHAGAVPPGGTLLVAGHHPDDGGTGFRNEGLTHLLFTPDG